MTLLVRDEEDIIATNIEYHRAQGVDFFIAMDNLSTDGTREILESYEKEGILHYILQEQDDYSQGEWVTSMARMASAKYGAKWVINNDADEFWWPLEGHSLRDCLLNVPKKHNVVKGQRYNFVPVKGEQKPFYERMIYREIMSLNFKGKRLPPKICHRGEDNVVVTQGNHKVSGFKTAIDNKRRLEILHFPFRTLRQYENKIIKGGGAYHRNKELRQGTGQGWRTLYDSYMREGRMPKYITCQVQSSVQIDSAMRQGSIVKDRRLRNYLAQIGCLKRKCRRSTN